MKRTNGPRMVPETLAYQRIFEVFSGSTVAAMLFDAFTGAPWFHTLGAGAVVILGAVAAPRAGGMASGAVMPRSAGLGDYLAHLVDDVGRTALGSVETRLRDEAALRALRGAVALAKQLKWPAERLRHELDLAVLDIYR